MKKLLYLLLILPVISLVSCDDDKDAPKVTVSVNIEGATRVGDVLYVVQGDDLTVESIGIKSSEGKDAIIGSATYYWDYYRFFATITKPYGVTITTSDVPEGSHLLEAVVTVYAVDYPPCEALLSYKVQIVKSAEQIPTEGDVENNPNLNLAVRVVNN